MMKMTYSLSTGTPPIASRPAVAGTASRAAASSRRSAVCCAETSWPSSVVGDLGFLLRAWYLPRTAHRSPRSRASLQLVLGHVDLARLEFAIQYLGRPRISSSSSCIVEHASRQVHARLLERLGLAVLAQHEQQDDRAERAADRVQEGHAEDVEFATARAASWPVLRGIRNEPCVRRASAQNAPGACGSPSIGIRMTFIGMPVG